MSLRNDRDKPKSKPLQFKRAKSNAFRNANIILLEGQPAVEIDTFKLKIGDGKTRYNNLPYIGYHCDVKDGKSAYQIWRDAGYNGTIDDFLNFCVGPAGKSTYEIWLSLGNEGTIVDFINSIQGSKGFSAYDLWIQEGNEGTVSDFLNSLIGKSAYDIWLSLGNEGNEADFINSLKGDSAYKVWLSLGNEGTEEDFIESLKGKSAFEIWQSEIGGPESTEEQYIRYMQTTSWGTF